MQGSLLNMASSNTSLFHAHLWMWSPIPRTVTLNMSLWSLYVCVHCICITVLLLQFNPFTGGKEGSKREEREGGRRGEREGGGRGEEGEGGGEEGGRRGEREGTDE